MSLQHFGKATLRVAKNYTKGYSDVQTKVRDATSNDPWGPTGQQMNELARLTYNQNDFVEIMEMLDKRLNDKGKNWRHVFKALTVLDYLLHNGSENVVIYFRDNLYIIKTLKEFQYVDEYSKDQGANVRQKAKDITNLLMDESRLREERRNRASMRDRMVRGANGSGAPAADGLDVENVENVPNGSQRPDRNRKRNREDDDLQRAIEASKLTAANEQARNAEEADLLRAIKLSEEEQAKRNRSLEEANSRSLFDEQAQTSSNNPFPLVDSSSQFSSPSPLQPQYTIATQYTSFNPFQLQLQQQQEAMQQEWLRQQQQQQQEEAQRLQQMQQMQQVQQMQQMQQMQDEWNRQQQQQQMQMQQQFMPPAQLLATQPTGFASNNPFAPSMQSSPPIPSTSTSSVSTPLENFSLPSTFSHSPVPQQVSVRSSSASPAPPLPTSRPAKNDGEHAHLANLIANRDDGQDTFGNVGIARFGQTQAGRIMAQKTGPTGLNPFAAQQQQTQQQGDQPFFSI